MIAFRAHKGGATQAGLTAGVYNAVSMPSCDYSTRYASSAWTPVIVGEEPRLVIFSGQVWVPYDGAPGFIYNGSENLVSRIIKNGDASTGVTIGTGVASKGPFSDDWVCALSMQDVAQPGDTYRLYQYAFDADAFIDGHPLHTFWCGVVVP